mmetsp:Transcript_33347/g.56976  ORF Transcript_33347/g.56976 Transcript_33347/m.56976 type:complete len:187 (-) Transcript_33347:36-596(-)
MRAFLVICLLIAVAFANECPDVPVVSPFDVASYLGVWYEIATTPTSEITFERDCYCTRANYTLQNDGTVLVQNSCNIGGVDGQVDIANGTAIIEDPTEPAKLSVTFGGHVYAPYWIIINDDYENAVVWSCANILGIDFDYMWVLSRHNTMSSATYAKLTAEAQELTGYDVSRLHLTTQSGCSYPIT